MNKFKLIMENWRGYIEEQEGREPTVGDFIQAMAKSHPKVMQRVLGAAPKVVAGIAVGALVAGAAAPAAAAAGVAAVGAGAAAGSAAAKGAELITGELATQIMNRFASKSATLGKWMVNTMRKNIPDSQRKPIDVYFDLDDDVASLIKGGAKTSPLFEKFANELAAEFQLKLDKMDGTEDLNTPLKDFLDGTASFYLNKLMKTGELGDEYKNLNIRSSN